MARKLEFAEELARLRPTPFTEVVFRTQGCHARHLPWSMSRELFLKPFEHIGEDAPFDEELGHDDWF
jgi:hypothetical protein